MHKTEEWSHVQELFLILKLYFVFTVRFAGNHTRYIYFLAFSCTYIRVHSLCKFCSYYPRGIRSMLIITFHVCMYVSLQWMCIPFALVHPAVGSLVESEHDWVGTVEKKDYGIWIDYAFLLIFGGIPWQVSPHTFSNHPTYAPESGSGWIPLLGPWALP